MRIPRSISLGLTLGALVLLTTSLVAPTVAGQGGSQTILGPGLYVFQTRTTTATCDDDTRDGYVTTFLAPVHGVPGSRTMRMQLTNSEYWPRWELTVNRQNQIIGEATAPGRRSHFEVARSGDRFVGSGFRTYRSGPRECRVNYDALLKQIDF